MPGREGTKNGAWHFEKRRRLVLQAGPVPGARIVSDPKFVSEASRGNDEGSFV